MIFILGRRKHNEKNKICLSGRRKKKEKVKDDVYSEEENGKERK